MADLERFIHATDDELPVLVRAGLAHVQFETIHPFLDGNGRLGRLLITLMLCDAGLLREPLLYLSLYFKRNRSTYYQLLGDIRRTGDWEAWLRFFLEGVREVAEAGDATARSVSETHSGRPVATRQPGTAGGIRHCECTSPWSNALPGASATSRGEPACPRRPWPRCSGCLRISTSCNEVTGRQRGRIFTYASMCGYR